MLREFPYKPSRSIISKLSKEQLKKMTSQPMKFMFEVKSFLTGKKNSIDDLFGIENLDIHVNLLDLNKLDLFVKEDDMKELLSSFKDAFNAEYLITFLDYTSKTKLPENILGGFHTHVDDTGYSDWGNSGDKFSIISNPDKIHAILCSNQNFKISFYKAKAENVVNLPYKIVESDKSFNPEPIENKIKEFSHVIDNAIDDFNAVPWLGCGAGFVNKDLPTYLILNSNKKF